MSFLARFDQFGVPYVPKITHDGQSQQRSLIGGLITISIYTLVCLYSGFVLYEWVQVEILPFISNEQEKIMKPKSLSLKDVLKIQYKDSNNHTSDGDPFNFQNNILQAQLRIYETDKEKNSIYYYSSVNSSCERIPGYSKPVCINQDQIISYNPVELQKSNNAVLFVTKCGLSNCSNQAKNFYEQTFHKAKLNLAVYEYHSNSNSIDLIELSEEFTIDSETVNVISLRLQMTHLTVDTGVLLPNIQEYNYLSGVTPSLTYVTPNHVHKVYGVSNVEFAVKISLDQNIIIKKVKFAKIGEVLAQILPLMQILLIVSYVAIFFNNYTLEERLETSVLNMFIPWIKELKVKRNWLGEVLQVIDKNGEHYEPKEYVAMVTKVKKTCVAKLNFLNIVYELSRIQFLLQSMIRREYFLASHQLVSHRILPKKSTRRKTLAQVHPVRFRLEDLDSDQLSTKKTDDAEIINPSSLKRSVKVLADNDSEVDDWILQPDDMELMMMRPPDEKLVPLQDLPKNQHLEMKEFFIRNIQY